MPLSFSSRAFHVAAALLLTSVASRGQSADELMARGDAAALRFQTAEALKDFLVAEKLEPKKPRLLVRISREYRYLMDDATKTGEKLRLGGIALDYAKRAAALGPNEPEAQLAVAITYGRLQPLVGTKEKIETSRIIKEKAERTIRLDPLNDLAWHVLGRWHMGYAEITGMKRSLAELTYGKLPVSTYEEAARCFEKAVALKPDRVLNYIELGEVYSRMGRTADARRVLNKGLALR
ncbi:MAG: hypothetical protein ABIU29_12970, partial [Chthoniobacterales bacterium]